MTFIRGTPDSSRYSGGPAIFPYGFLALGVDILLREAYDEEGRIGQR